jgi:phospholipid-binding lipoprotein MlaA
MQRLLDRPSLAAGAVLRWTMALRVSMAEVYEEGCVRRTIFATAACVVLLNNTPALAANGPAPHNDDPWERLNRRFYSFNQGLDRALIRPAAMAYSHILPSPLRTGIRNLLSNAGEPTVIINDVLQVRFKRAGRETGRFLLNTVAGVGGIFDIATGAGIEHEGTNFGITLGRYGVKPGPYLYLPVVGPTTVRGAVGAAVGGALDPLYWVNYPHKTVVSLSRAVVTGLDLRAEADASLKSLTADATDPYATLRSAYLQNLQSQVSDDNLPVQSLPDFDDVNAPPPAAPSPPSSDQPATPAPSAAEASAQTEPAAPGSDVVATSAPQAADIAPAPEPAPVPASTPPASDQNSAPSPA